MTDILEQLEYGDMCLCPLGVVHTAMCPVPMRRAARDEIERLRAVNKELLRVMQKAWEDGHTDCVADGTDGQRCDAICTKVWQMCAGCQLRVTLASEAD